MSLVPRCSEGKMLKKTTVFSFQWLYWSHWREGSNYTDNTERQQLLITLSVLSRKLKIVYMQPRSSAPFTWLVFTSEHSESIRAITTGVQFFVHIFTSEVKGQKLDKPQRLLFSSSPLSCLSWFSLESKLSLFSSVCVCTHSYFISQISVHSLSRFSTVYCYECFP